MRRSARAASEARLTSRPLSSKPRQAAGSIGYAAPEVLTNAGHGKPVDLWSLGSVFARIHARLVGHQTDFSSTRPLASSPMSF